MRVWGLARLAFDETPFVRKINRTRVRYNCEFCHYEHEKRKRKNKKKKRKDSLAHWLPMLSFVGRLPRDKILWLASKRINHFHSAVVTFVAFGVGTVCRLPG